MNNSNCPKCGNPLQIGTTSCPICGTIISKTNEGNKPQVTNVQGTNTTPNVNKGTSPSGPVSQPSPRPVAQMKQVKPINPVNQPRPVPVRKEPVGQANLSGTSNQADRNATTDIYAANPKTNPATPNEPAVQVEPVSASSPVKPVAPPPVPEEPVPTPVPEEPVPTPVPVEAPAPISTQPSQPTPIPVPSPENASPELPVQTANASVTPTAPVSPNDATLQAPNTQAQNVVVGSVSTPQQTNQVLLETSKEESIPVVNSQDFPSNVQSQEPTTATVSSVAPSLEQPTSIKPLTVPVDPASVPSAPSVEAITSNSPIPNIPASLNITPNAENVAPETSAPTTEKPLVKKKTLGKTPLIICIVAVAAIAGGIIFTMSHPGSKNNILEAPKAAHLETTSVLSNGYKLDLPKEWSLKEDGKNVIITNSNDSVIIKLNEAKTPITSITKEMIEQQLSTKAVFTNANVAFTQISARDAFVVNATYNNYPSQIYFISNDTTATLGVTIIYQSEDSKTKYESNVLELISTIVYNDNAIKGIDTTGMYDEVFNIFNNVIANDQPESATPAANEGQTENQDASSQNE